MANTFTLSGLAPKLYEGMEIVGRELTGGITSMTINSSGVARAALGDEVESFTTSQPTLGTSYNPSMTVPDADDVTVGKKAFSINKTVLFKIPLVGEKLRQLENSWGKERVNGNVLIQTIRKMVNTIESYAMTKAYQGASRAYGTAGTTPFASDHKAMNHVRQILVDNGVDVDSGEVSLILNTLAGTNFRNLSNLYKVNESGSDDLLRQGVLQDISNIKVKESAGIASHTKGTGASILVNGALAVGATTITADGGTGTILAGDVVSFAADSTNKYVATSALADGSFTIGAPGLRVAITDNNAITVGASHTGNVAFHRSAIELAMRAPAMPDGGDLATDRMMFQDPHSGLVFDMAVYKGYGMNLLHVMTHYDAKVWNEDHAALLLG